MSPPDDLHPVHPPASESAGVPPDRRKGGLREIGPESEVRGGPEAPDTEPVGPNPTDPKAGEPS